MLKKHIICPTCHGEAEERLQRGTVIGPTELQLTEAMEANFVGRDGGQVLVLAHDAEIPCRTCNATGKVPATPFLLALGPDVLGYENILQLLQEWAQFPAKADILQPLHDALEENGHEAAAAAIRQRLGKRDQTKWLWDQVTQRHGPGMHKWLDVLQDAFGDFPMPAPQRVLERCDHCLGTGDTKFRQEPDWHVCPWCNGTGNVVRPLVAREPPRPGQYLVDDRA